jgi:hypothetical protein
MFDSLSPCQEVYYSRSKPCAKTGFIEVWN